MKLLGREKALELAGHLYNQIGLINGEGLGGLIESGA